MKSGHKFHLIVVKGVQVLSWAMMSVISIGVD